MGEVLRTRFGKGVDGAVAIDFDGRSVQGAWGARRIEPRAAQVLERLVEAGPAVVSRDTLLEHCWPDGDGSDEALTQAIAQLRRALGDKPGAPRFIQTVPKRGYRWIGEEASASLPARRLVRFPPANLATLAAAAAAGLAVVAIFLAVKPAPQPQQVQETVLVRRSADGKLTETRYFGPPRHMPQARSSSPLPSGSLRYSDTPSPPEP